MEEKNIKSYSILKLIKYIYIILIVIGIVLFVMWLRKQYIISKKSYTKYEKSVVTEVVDYKITKIPGSRKNSPQSYITYTFYSESTGNTVKLKEKYDSGGYEKGEKVLLIYYNVYEKNTNKLLKEKFFPKTLSYFENGNFFGVLDDSYIYYHTGYADKVINFKLDYKPDRQEKNLLIFDDSNYNLCILSKGLNQNLISEIKNRIKLKSKIEIIETNLGTVYNLNINSSHYSVLNYGDSLNNYNSITLLVSDRNILDFISNAEIYTIQNYN
ncbi:MAG: hypothetical protein J6J60_06895 [Clostridia bacterium]|nr:hypothetical protein [Clostridia bacterium]